MPRTRETGRSTKSGCPENDVLLLLFFRQRRASFFLKGRNKRHCETGCVGRQGISRISRFIRTTKNGRLVCESSVLCRAPAKPAEARRATAPQMIFFCFFSSKKKRRGVRFLFLKKRNKRRCGTGCSRWKSRFPARPAWNEKRAVHNENRPFCAVCRRKWQ